MKNRKVKRLNGYYIAIGVGVLAFAGLLGIYTYEQQAGRQKQEIDLNAEAQYTKATVTTEEMKETNAQVVKQRTSETTTEKKAKKEAKKPKQKKEKAKTVKTNQTAILSKITWPVVGNVILPYSMKTTVYYQTLDTYKCSKGMLIQGKEDGAVHAGARAVVKNIATNEEFGRIITLDPGNGYELIYGQLKDVQVKQGQTVRKGQSIGTLATPTSNYTLEGTHVYFQVNKNGEPVDPMKFLE